MGHAAADLVGNLLDAGDDTIGMLLLWAKILQHVAAQPSLFGGAVAAMVLRPGSIEWGSRRSEMQRVDYSEGDLGICHRHEGEWVGIMDLPRVRLGISDAVLMSTHDGISGEVELRPQRKSADAPLASVGRGRECGEGSRVS